MRGPNYAIACIDPTVITGQVTHLVDVTFTPEDNNIQLDARERLKPLGAEPDKDEVVVPVYITTIVGADEDARDHDQLAESARQILASQLRAQVLANKIDHFEIGDVYGFVVDRI